MYHFRSCFLCYVLKHNVDLIVVLCYCVCMYFISYKKMFEDTKGVIKSRKSKKGRQQNDYKKNNKRTNNDIQNISQKTKARATRTPTLGTRHRTVI
jgi:hypothetical protein